MGMIIGGGSDSGSIDETRLMVEELRKLVLMLLNKSNIDSLVIEFLIKKVGELTNSEDINKELEEYVQNRITELQQQKPSIVIPD
jgi:ABC-type hemin transport system substrate-binding protein